MKTIPAFLAACLLLAPMLQSADTPFFTSPGVSVSVSEAARSDTAPDPHGLLLPQNLSLPGVDWPERGSLTFLLQVDGVASSRDLEIERGSTLGLRFLEGPAFDLQLFFSHNGSGAIGWLFHTEDGRTQRFNAPFIHLRGGQPYLIHLNWDLAEKKAEFIFNGISQGDIGHGSSGDSALALRPERPTRLTGEFSAGAPIHLQLAQLELRDAPLDEEAVRQLPALATIPPLVDEGRVIFDGSLDLNGFALETLHHVDFSEPIAIIREQELFEGDQRVRRPTAEESWILEGPEGMLVETRADGLFMQTPDPEDNADGHWVLWLNKYFPDNYLVEYSFTPHNDRRGLNILFFSAHHPEGESIFDLDLPFRGGNFRPYIVGAINSYHISPWATDGQNLRATSNMRKNSGFHLVARGNDVIGGAGPGPHTVRILKVGNEVRMEANGVLCLAFNDDGEAYGPVHGGGYLGVRFMAHTRYATLHDLRVYSVEPCESLTGK